MAGELLGSGGAGEIQGQSVRCQKIRLSSREGGNRDLVMGF